MFNPARRLLNLPGDFRFSEAFKDRKFKQLSLRLGQAVNKLLKQAAPLFYLCNISPARHPGTQPQ